MSYPLNDDPWQPWNDPFHKDDPFAPHNNPMYRDDPFKPWNDPFGKWQDLDDSDRRAYRKPSRDSFDNDY